MNVLERRSVAHSHRFTHRKKVNYGWALESEEDNEYTGAYAHLSSASEYDVFFSVVDNELVTTHKLAENVSHPLPQWLVDKAFKEVAVVRRELKAKEEYYSAITPLHVEMAAGLVAFALWDELRPELLTTTLTTDQSLHVYAALPDGIGTAHVSVLFSPDLDPTETEDQGEDADNTIISVYDRTGKFRAGTTGPLCEALCHLKDLASKWNLAVLPGYAEED